MADLDQISTIVVVMMENRSFDHMLGYLSLNEFDRTDVDGLKDDNEWRAEVASTRDGSLYLPFRSQDPFSVVPADPPHEREPIASQLETLMNGVYPMKGFVASYATVQPVNPGDHPPVMSYFMAEEAPVTDFLADNFAICDRWFSSLPAGTQPNRLMAMSGMSKIDKNVHVLPDQDLVYDWLTARGIRWCVYHEGIPFFTMMPKCIPDVLADNHFRSFASFESDLVNTPPNDLPQVIFVEPTYTDAPHLGYSTDDHAPSGIANGQEFLMQVYNAATNAPNVWRGLVMIITYDEHGGFFDHVSPPLIRTDPPEGASYPSFDSLGVRVPAYVVSPFVAPRSVSHVLLDHTSVLKLLGQKFGKGSYSTTVDTRPVHSVSEVLNVDVPMSEPPPIPPLNDYFARRLAAPSVVTGLTPVTPLQQGFHQALATMQQQGAGPNHSKFGPLLKRL